MYRTAAAVIFGALAIPASADEVKRIPATGSVSEVMDRLEAAVAEAGATVFARVDHGAEALGKMSGAPGKLTAAAAGG